MPSSKKPDLRRIPNRIAGFVSQADPRRFVREWGSESLIRCGGCGHSRQEHRGDDTCTVPVCTCVGYLSMDRVFFAWTGSEGTWFTAGNMMTRTHSGLDTDKTRRELTSSVIGESLCP